MDILAFSVSAEAYAAARRAGWEQADIDGVLEEAMSGDYNHLLATTLKHCDTKKV